MAARALLDKFGLPSLDLGGARLICGRLGERLVLAGHRLRPLAPIEFEGDDPVRVFVFESGTRWRDRSDPDARSAIAGLNSDILPAVDDISHWRGHDVASGLNRLQDFSAVGSIDPEFAIAATLEHEIARSAHHPAVVSAHTGCRLMFPDHFLRDWVPGPDEFPQQLDLARALERFAVRQSPVIGLQRRRMIVSSGKTP